MKDRKSDEGSLPPLLEVEGICKDFGGIRALNDVSFEVAAGTIHGVIGPNGAGKTTLFNTVTGAYAPDGGRIVFRGEEIQGRRVHELVAKGMARTFQNIELFGSMSVLENVLVGRHVRMRYGFLGAVAAWPGARREEREARERAMELLEFTGLSDVAGQRSSDIPFGRQRMLEIARALAAEPTLMLLDEPASGLNAAETRGLGELLEEIRARGVTLLLVEHDMSLTMGVCDRILVMHQGSRLAEGTPREIQADESVIAAYLGREDD